MATVEAAIAIATLVFVLVLCLGAVAALTAQVRCVDAARESARLAARGDRAAAEQAGRRVGPSGAALTLTRDGEYTVADVRYRSPLLPMLTISARAVAAQEPGEDPGEEVGGGG